MSQEKLQAAKKLIQSGHYDEARNLLYTMPDDPTARRWLTKLKEIEPPSTSSISSTPIRMITTPAQNKTSSKNYLVIGATTGILGLAIGLILGILIMRPTATTSVASVPTSQILPTITEKPVTSTPQGPTSIELTATRVVLLNRTVESQLAATQTANSWTPTPTATPRFTSTPELGTRDNPLETGKAWSVGDGYLQIGNLFRNMDSRVADMNMFNDEPDSGQEWVLISAIFACDLPSNHSCDLDSLRYRMELVGEHGVVYTQPFGSVLDLEFGGEVFGDGVGDGIIGFIVEEDDSNFLLAINYSGERIFFDIDQ